ncbi:hypothetical protein BELL_0123g00090 [Botrytis elliptica]|uniref:Uncharacterized protein n=1 Tax=Botrytis elliptica TaxID=278938 RepID=A0A4Z1JV69_9HELO|nr:hypothetical protein BELL_0123g00090 [Botrytis elliptica]
MIFKLLILIILLSYWYSNHLKRKSQQAPLGLNILKRQYDALLSGHLLSFQAEHFEKMGEAFGSDGFLTTDPENLEAILGTRFNDRTSDSAPTAQNSPMIGEGIFTQDSHSRKPSRSILHRQFSRVQSQSQNLSIFSAPLEKILAVLSSRSGTIDLQPLFFLFRFTLETNHYFSSLRRELLSSFPLPFLPLPFPPLPIQTRSPREKFLLHLPHLISALHLRLRLSNLY